MDTIRALLFLMFILIMGCLLSYANANEAAPFYQVSKKCSVSDKYVRLKHLLSSDIQEKVGETLICKRPVEGIPVTLTGEYVKSLLEVQGHEEFLTRCFVPDEILVEYEVPKTSVNSTGSISRHQDSDKREINMDEIILLVTSHAESLLKDYEPKIAMYQSNQNFKWVAEVAENYDLKLLPGFQVRKNMISAKVGLYHKEKLIDSRYFSFKAEVLINCLVAKENINKDSVLSENQFEWKFVEYSDKSIACTRELSDLNGMATKTSLKINDGVEKKDLALPKIIKKGQNVTINVNNKDFSITTSGIAQEDGCLNENILILVPSFQNKVLCQVKNSDTVELIR